MLRGKGKGPSNIGENMTTTTTQHSGIQAAILKAAEIKKAQYHGNSVAEGKQAAIRNYGHLIDGQITAEEYASYSEYAVEIMCKRYATQSSLDFAIAYLTTTNKITASL